MKGGSSTADCPVFQSYISENPNAVVIAIYGKWYDVTDFRYRHPGGALLLERMHGKDCSDLYFAFHGSQEKILKYFPSVGPVGGETLSTASTGGGDVTPTEAVDTDGPTDMDVSSDPYFDPQSECQEGHGSDLDFEGPKDPQSEGQNDHQKGRLQSSGQLDPSLGRIDPDRDSLISKAFLDLGKEMEKDGLFLTSYEWYFRKFIFIFSLLGISVYLVVGWPDVRLSRALLSGFFLGLFWQQCGYVMHDAMHAEITHKRRYDRVIGLIFGSLCLGVSSHWWRDEHFEHHAFTNVIDSNDMYGDPQMIEDVWVQDSCLFPTTLVHRWSLKRWVIKRFVAVQAYLWVVLALFVGRIAIAFDSMHLETRWYEWVAVGLHNAFILTFMSKAFPSFRTALAWWYMGAVVEGILHVQLLVNHYPKPWIIFSDLCETISWPRMQVENTLNITCPWWLDWFYGGLNYHVEHHLYPLMPRHNFSKARGRVKGLCERLGLIYDETDFLTSIIITTKKFHTLSQEYKTWYGGELWAEWFKIIHHRS